MEFSQLLDELYYTLIQADECLINTDPNTALKKVHECLTKIKNFKDKSHE